MTMISRHCRGWSVGVVLALTVAAGCATSTNGIARYQEVRPKVLYRGGQPSDEGFRHLKEAGIRTVVDLRRGDRSEEERTVRELGMKYVNVPSRPEEPSDENLARVLRVVLDPANQPVFVHCRHGRDRTGTVAAVYRMAMDNWSYERASSELRGYQGISVLYFPQIPAYLSRLDAGRFRQMIGMKASAEKKGAGDVRG